MEIKEHDSLFTTLPTLAIYSKCKTTQLSKFFQRNLHKILPCKLVLSSALSNSSPDSSIFIVGDRVFIIESIKNHFEWFIFGWHLLTVLMVSSASTAGTARNYPNRFLIKPTLIFCATIRAINSARFLRNALRSEVWFHHLGRSEITELAVKRPRKAKPRTEFFNQQIILFRWEEGEELRNERIKC